MRLTRSALKTLAPTLALLMVAWSAPSAAEACQAWCGDGSDAVALVGVNYEVDVFGAVALGRLVQEFRYDGEEPLEVSYRAPGSLGFRVTSLTLEIDGERVEAEAQKETPQARQRNASRTRTGAGQRSAKPLAAAGITLEPGQTIQVRTGFQRTLTLHDGLFQLSLPAVKPAALAGSGARVASEYGDPEALPVYVAVTVHHEEPLAHAESSSHEIFVAYQGSHTLIELAHGEELGDRKFELDVAIGPEDDATLLGYVGAEIDGTREVMAVLTPPSRPRTNSVRPKQMVFVLDTSGSMAKGKLDQAREALYASLLELGETDRFNVVEFDGEHSLMHPVPVLASEEAIGEAAAWLRSQRAGGSTKLLPALQAAFELPQESDLHSMIVVLSDGNVQDGTAVQELLRQKLGEGRLFFVGIGADVNQDNIVRFAESGRGTAAFAQDADGLGEAVAILFDSISRPLAWDLEIDWGGARVESVKPSRLPDLYAGRPVTVFARVSGELPTELKLHGSTMEGQRTFSVVLPSEGLEALPRSR